MTSFWSPFAPQRRIPLEKNDRPPPRLALESPLVVGPMMIEIETADRQTAVAIDASWFVGLAEHVFAAELVERAVLSVAFVDAAAIHKLNRRFLSHDYPTDVLTFPLSEDDAVMEGEVVVSTDFAAAAAVGYQWPVSMEAGLYLVHGILHLCGYDDGDDEDQAVMHRRQEVLLRDYLKTPRGSVYAGRPLPPAPPVRPYEPDPEPPSSASPPDDDAVPAADGAV
ncbi:MAG: rRNA maturation RNase YbeY [Planctomycetia bacterium]